MSLMIHPTYAFWAGVCAGVLTLFGTVPYTISIFRGKTQPNRVTWGVWTLVQLLLTISYWKVAEEKWAIWVSVSYTIVTVWVFGLSLHYGVQQWDQLDIFCIIVATLLILLWGFIGSSWVLIIALCLDVSGALPTLKKAIRFPLSEDCLAWVFGFCANLLNLFAVRHW